MKLFRFLFGLDAAALLVAFGFFVTGLSRATNDNYVGVWLPVLLIPAALLWAGWTLKSKGKVGLANLVLALPALPVLFYMLFVALFIVLAPDMK